MIFAPPAQELASLQAATGFIVTARPNSHLWYLQLNANEPYWKDARVRQAFFMSINRAGMAKQLLRRHGAAGRQRQRPHLPVMD